MGRWEAYAAGSRAGGACMGTGACAGAAGIGAGSAVLPKSLIYQSARSQQHAFLKLFQ